MEVLQKISLAYEKTFYTFVAVTKNPFNIQVSGTGKYGYNDIYKLPSGLYCATISTVSPAPFNAAAACSCVASRRSIPLTCNDINTF